MEKKSTELTRGEEEIMQILWRLGDAVVNEIIAQTEEPRPKYTTVATFLKILENKGFVGHTPEGKSHRYYPLVGREQYARGVMSSVLTSYFDGSLAPDGVVFLAERRHFGQGDGRDSRNHAERKKITRYETASALPDSPAGPRGPQQRADLRSAAGRHAARCRNNFRDE